MPGRQTEYKRNFVDKKNVNFKIQMYKNYQIKMYKKYIRTFAGGGTE